MPELTLRITDRDDDVLLLQSQEEHEHFAVIVTVGPRGIGPDDIAAGQLRRVGLDLEDLEALSDYASTIAAARRMAEYRLREDA